MSLVTATPAPKFREITAQERLLQLWVNRDIDAFPHREGLFSAAVGAPEYLFAATAHRMDPSHGSN